MCIFLYTVPVGGRRVTIEQWRIRAEKRATLCWASHRLGVQQGLSIILIQLKEELLSDTYLAYFHYKNVELTYKLSCRFSCRR